MIIDKWRFSSHYFFEMFGLPQQRKGVECLLNNERVLLIEDDRRFYFKKIDKTKTRYLNKKTKLQFSESIYLIPFSDMLKPDMHNKRNRDIYLKLLEEASK
jgi:hypothetical protein